MKPVWWTCGCGQRNCSRGPGKPVCCREDCGKQAGFAINPPKEQAGFDFGGESPPRPTGYEED